MKALFAVLTLTACGIPRPADVPDSTLAQLSHQVLLAYDNGDVGRLDTVLATNFVRVEGGTTTTRAEELKVPPNAVFPLVAKRKWTEERVISSPDVRIFRGLADEEQAGNDAHGNFHFQGWYTLIWLRERSAWHLGMLTWQLAGNDQENSWNAIYKGHVGFTRTPNKLLAASVVGVTPGRALDVATGQGRNGLYLASLGWKVTGVDFSMEGLREARAYASAKNLDFDPVYADLATYDFGIDTWNLVDMIYTPDHPEWVERIKPSIKRGGLFVLEFFARASNEPTGGTDLAALDRAFAGWDIKTHEVVDDVPDWAQSRAKLVRFVAKRP